MGDFMKTSWLLLLSWGSACHGLSLESDGSHNTVGTCWDLSYLLPKAAAGHSWGVGTLERGLPAPGAQGKPSPTTSSSSSGPRDKEELVDSLQP